MFYLDIHCSPLQLINFLFCCYFYFCSKKWTPHRSYIGLHRPYIDLPTSVFTPPHFVVFPSLLCLCTICVQTISCFLRLTVFSSNANTYSLGSLLTSRNFPQSQKASRNDFHGPLGQALSLPSHVFLARPVLFC